jgi:hypothetical protein
MRIHFARDDQYVQVDIMANVLTCVLICRRSCILRVYFGPSGDRFLVLPKPIHHMLFLFLFFSVLFCHGVSGNNDDCLAARLTGLAGAAFVCLSATLQLV